MQRDRTKTEGERSINTYSMIEQGEQGMTVSKCSQLVNRRDHMRIKATHKMKQMVTQNGHFCLGCQPTTNGQEHEQQILYFCIIKYVMSLNMKLSELDNEKACIRAADVFAEAINAPQASLKEINREIQQQMLQVLTSSASSPKTCFYNLLLLREITLRPNVGTKFLSALSSSKLYAYLEDQAFKVDAKKAVADKGRMLFPKDPETGNNCMCLILQAFGYWGAKFPTTGSQLSKYRKTLDKLHEQKVKMPQMNKECRYYPSFGVKKEAVKERSSVETPADSQPDKFVRMIMLVKGRIDTLLSMMQDTKDPAELEKEIQNNHQRFAIDYQTFQQKQLEICSALPDDAVSMEKLFKVSEFLDRERQYYAKYKSDTKSYVSQYMKAYDDIFPEENEPQKPPPKVPSSKNAAQPPKAAMDTIASVIKSLKTENERGKSPIGFRQIGSLSKEKAPCRTSLMKSRLAKSSSLIKKVPDMDQSSIFTNPPNKSPNRKEYEGELIKDSQQIAKGTIEMRKEQGSRRFKIANFRNKHSLFENQSMQIGFKSEIIYEKVSKHDTLINLEIFVGNKTKKPFTNVSSQWHGDKNSIVYTNPHAIEETIEPEKQVKLDSLLIPVNIVFGIFTLRMSYQCEGKTIKTAVVVPNTVLKLATYQSMQRGSLTGSWRACPKVIKSQRITLSRHFPPNCLRNYIRELTEFSDYDEFCQAGSNSDYELFCSVRVKQKYSGVLRINIRPDLTAVIQIGISANSSAAVEQFAWYLQTLSFILNQEKF